MADNGMPRSVARNLESLNRPRLTTAVCPKCGVPREITVDAEGKFTRHYDAPVMRYKESRIVCEGSGSPAPIKGKK